MSIPNPATPITRVVLSEISGDSGFLYDDLEFTFIPEPHIATLLLGLPMLLRTRRRTQGSFHV